MLRIFHLLALSACGSVVQNPHSSEPDAGADGAAPSIARVAILDDFDQDFTNSPFDDRLTVLTFDLATNTASLGAPVSGINTSQTIGGNHAIAVSPDGALIAAVENATPAIPIFDKSMQKLTTIAGSTFISVAVTDARIYGASDQTGIRAYDAMSRAEVSGSPSATMNGFDLAVDTQRNVLWGVGTKLWRGNATTLQGAEVASYGWFAVSMDIASDGSVWVAERNHPDAGGIDALRHYSNSGAEIASDTKLLQGSPFCVRVHPKTGDVWFAGAAGVGRYDAAGYHAVDSSGPFWTLAIDPATGTVFAGGFGTTNISVFAQSGTPLATVPGFSTSVKSIAVIP